MIISKGENRLHNTMMQKFYAMNVINSGNVESKISEKHAIPASIVSFFIELIPKVGGKIANILHGYFKSFTVDRVLKNASINMQNPSDTEFKIYINILTSIINLKKKINLDALNKKQLKDLTEKFFDFASKNNTEDIWENSGGLLKQKLEKALAKNNLKKERAEFILFATKFASETEVRKGKIETSKKPNWEEVQKLVSNNLNQITQIKTESEKNKESIEIAKKESDEKIMKSQHTMCTILSQISVTSMKECMLACSAA